MANQLEQIKTFVNSFRDFFVFDIGIDLGTANTLVYVKGEGIVLCEPSVVAVRKGSNQVLAVGDEAKRMLGRTPGTIIAIRPMRDGVIADFDISERMLRYFIDRVHTRKRFIKPLIAIAVPTGITEVEKRAVIDSAERAGAREVHLIEQPKAAAIGVGLPVQEPIGNMIVDIGGGTTEIAIISLGGIVCAESLRIGGDKMDDAIIQHLKRSYNLMVGERTAEEIKINLGSAYPLDEEITLEVKGRDLIAGLPKTIRITSQEIREALSEPIAAIVGSVRVILEKAPPELSADLITQGIVLVGGGSLLRGLDRLINEETGLPVRVAEDALTAVALGTGKFLSDIHAYRKMSPKKERV